MEGGKSSLHKSFTLTDQIHLSPREGPSSSSHVVKDYFFIANILLGWGNIKKILKMDSTYG